MICMILYVRNEVKKIEFSESKLNIDEIFVSKIISYLQNQIKQNQKNLTQSQLLYMHFSIIFDYFLYIFILLCTIKCEFYFVHPMQLKIAILPFFYNTFITMTKRHFSPEQFTVSTHSLEKDHSRKLREAGSSSNLFASVTLSTANFEDTENIGPYFYRKKDAIGDGYSSFVYRGRSQLDNDFHAIKVIDTRKFTSSSMQMLENQIKILTKLKHPNILALQNVYKTSTHCYLVTEYCSGGDLLNYMTKMGKFCEKEALQINNEIIQAVKYLLSQGIIHRDIKPANIFKSNKHWKIGDFGFAIYGDGQIKTRHNVGTPLYMSLQSLLRNMYSPESDIFAVGVILYELIIGITPWQCNSQKQLIKRMSSIPFSIPQKYQISQPIKYFLTKLCAINREERMSKQQFMNVDLSKINNIQELIQSNQTTHRKSRFHSVGRGEDSTNKRKQQKSKKKVKATEEEYMLKKKAKKSIPKTQRNLQKVVVKDVKIYGVSHKSSRSNSSKKKLEEIHLSSKVSVQQILSEKQQEQNYNIILSQLTLVRFIYYLIQNSHYLSLSYLSVSRITFTMFKHILKLIKHLADYRSNWFHLHSWENYKKTSKYQNLYKTLKEYCIKYQKQYLIFLKKAQINVIKEINQKLAQFSTNQPFTVAFYKKLLDFVAPFVRQCNHNISATGFEKLGRGDDTFARIQALRSLLKYYRLLQISMKEFQDFNYFAKHSNIQVLKNYRQAQSTVKQYAQLRMEIKMI